MSNFSEFFALLKQLPAADKETLVYSYSGGRTTSLREFAAMDKRGFGYMLGAMRDLTDKNPTNVEDSENIAVKRRYRSLILKAMQSQGVAVINGDWSPVNDFVAQYAGEGKTLSNMSLDELKTFNKQVHKLLDWYNAKREQRAAIALMN